MLRDMPLPPTTRIAFAVGLAMLMGLSAVPSQAVSLRVKLACSSDYRAHCSRFPSDSAEVRQCMRAAGERLSPRCLQALISAGEVTEAEVAARRAEHMRGR
ncbi:hypothetical protein DLM45_09775 [Hyphomicrobium methylovorum]|nr:hypothetical protein [Hyphomicrobium methylovorum]